MKCPKCSYLGFETGDRCKNCGYDFSLMASEPASASTPDPVIRNDETTSVAPDLWLRLRQGSGEQVDDEDPPAEDSKLPLFNPSDADDTPLISMPVAPRPPLSVRRTPEGPRLRPVPRAARSVEPALNFREDLEPEPDAPEPELVRPVHVTRESHEVGGRRLAAALLDHAMLLAIDASVVYFTLRMAGLDASDYAALPLAPMFTFLGLLKISYFTAFTAVGGQTIGKMALRIRVVGDNVHVDSGRAIRRTLAGVLSLLPLGLGFLPAFVGADRRALHDRLTHTRVVGLPSA
jgi:uncharacterized RDD family membrane protein YckC